MKPEDKGMNEHGSFYVQVVETIVSLAGLVINFELD